MNKPHRVRPRFDCLEERYMLSASITEVEVNDRAALANSFDVPPDGIVQIQGVSTSKRDKDFFRLVAPTSGPVDLVVSAPGGRFAQLELKDTAGNELFETEPNDGINSGRVTLTGGQAYLLRMRSKENSAASYLVDMLFGGGAGGGGGGGGSGGGGSGGSIREAEVNDRKSQANLFQLEKGASVTLIGTSLSKRDKDFFRFTPAAAGTLQATVRTTNGQFAQLEIETAAGVNVLETQPNDGINSGSAALTAGTTYFVRLRSPSLSAAAYEVDLSFA